MKLDQLLRALGERNPTVILGDASTSEVHRVEQLRPSRPPGSGTLLLVAARADLDELHSQRGLLLVASEPDLADSGTLERLRSLDAVVVSWPDRIPLDLAARLQQILERDEPEKLPSDTIARARQDLVGDVLFGRYRDPASYARRARALGIDLAGLRTVLLVGFVDFERFYLQHEERGEFYFQHLKGKLLHTVRRELLRDEPRAVVVPHGEGALALLPYAADLVGPDLARTLRKEFRLIPLAVAGGTPGEGPEGLGRSFREAEAALQLRHRLRLRERFVAFRDLTGYALLQQIEHAPEIAALLESEIAPLHETEYGRKPVLVETLAAYYDAGSSLKQAAEALGIHPKTLRYRLDRIQEVLGPDALAGEKRLLLHLAARLHLWTQP